MAHRSFRQTTFKFLAINLVLQAQVLFAQGHQATSADEAEIRTAIQQYSRSYDSINSPSQIPLYITYHLAFKEVQSDPALRERITADDLAFISALPKPTDQHFVAQDQLELNAICIDITQDSLDSLQIMSIADAFDQSRLRRDTTLTTHYLNATAALSQQGQEQIHALMEDFRFTRNIAYSTFDLGGFASEYPHAALSILRQGCTVFYQQLGVYQ